MARFFEATTDAIFFLDRGYNFTFLNRRAKELLSASGDPLGKNLYELYPATKYEGSPYIENYSRSMNGEAARSFEAYYPEPFNFWLSIQSYPAEDGIMVFFRDITAEKEAHESLLLKTAQAERQLAEIEALYRTAPIGLALFDTDEYRYLRLNETQAAFFGKQPDEVVGRTLTQMAPIEGLKDLFDTVRGGTPIVNYPLEGELVTDPGNHRYWTVSYFPVFANDGSVQAITSASLEITQQKKAEQALIQSEKLAVVGRLASSIAHEINNPLEAVTNLLYLARNAGSMKEVHSYINLAEIELRRVSAITSQTLRFHKQTTSPQAITPQDLVATVLSIYQGRIVNSFVQVLERHRSLQPIRCFEGEVRQVISNLVGNALDALATSGQQHPHLFIRSREATRWSSGDRGIIFTVADNGTGMSADTLAKLFKAFFTTKGIMGTGLGLWVSQEIIDRHRGALRVRSSQCEGRSGTIFTIFLPFDAASREGDVRSEASARTPRG